MDKRIWYVIVAVVVVVLLGLVYWLSSTPVMPAAEPPVAPAPAQ